MNLMVKCEGLGDPHCFWTFSSFLQKKTGGLFVASCLPFRYHVFADNDTKGVQMNDIINLLGLEDETVKIIDVSIADGCKTITAEKILYDHYCPSCGCRMYSRGVKVRTVNHPVFQDGFKTILKLRHRRWRCKACGLSFADDFKFVDRYSHSTNVTDLLILEDMKNLHLSVCHIADKFNVSDTYVHQVFDRYVDMKRLPLSEVICIDEVHTEAVSYSKYSMIILDFITGQPIDMLPSRQKRDTEEYFSSIPIQERRKVKYLVTDMYNPYLALAEKYFPNAICAVDSYHVIQWILHRLNLLLISFSKEYAERDRRYIERRQAEHLPVRSGWVSDETYLLKNHRWILLKNQDNIDYSAPARKDRHFGFYMDAHRYEEYFFRIHPDFERIRDLKEKYIRFNDRNAGHVDSAGDELDALIDEYEASGFPAFKGFAFLLRQYRSEIIHSFILVDKYDGTGESVMKRLSSGLIESFNRKPKDMKRLSRGYRNFNHMRNRLLFAERHDPPILGIPKTYGEVRNLTGRKRGSYNKTYVAEPTTDETSASGTSPVTPDDDPKGGYEDV